MQNAKLGKPLRVLFVSHDSGPYGAQRSLLSLVAALKKRGLISPIVVAPNEGFLTEGTQRAKITTLQQKYHLWLTNRPSWRRHPYGLFKILQNFLAARKLLQRVEALDVQLVYSNSIASSFGGILAYFAGKPHIWHVREVTGDRTSVYFNVPETLAHKLLTLKVDGVVANSISTTQSEPCNQLPLENRTVIYNGFDFPLPDARKIKARKLTDAKPKNLLMVGSLTPVKGHSVAIRAIHALQQKGVNVELMIAGEGDAHYVDSLKSLVEELNLSRQVQFLGYQSQTRNLFLGATALLIASSWESFGRTAVEGMAFGTPVICSDQGGTTEIVTDDHDGYLFRTGDPEKLAEAYSKLISDPEQYSRLSQNAIDTAFSRFSLERYAQDVENFVVQTLARKTSQQTN